MEEQRAETKNGTVERLSRAQLSPEEDHVGKAILKAFAKKGKAPSLEEVAQTLGLPLALVQEACRRLAAHDLIVWQDDEARLLSAYPFSGMATAHQMCIDGHTLLYAMCAIDVLGIPFMLDQGASIQPACFFCHTSVYVEIRGGLLQGADPSTLVVWSSERESAVGRRCAAR
jgi:alkylmercury lyase